jgi:ABC-type transport system substrate-binding protein
MPARFAFRCLLPEDPALERTALVVQKQLYDVGVDMQIVTVPVRELGARVAAGDFEAFLIEMTSGRSLAWVYRFWHSPAPGLPPTINSGYRAADAALERMRAAVDDAEVRGAVADLQRVLYEDPPAVFLAWGAVSRAVSEAFVVPEDGGPDIMSSLWQWRPRPAEAARR